MKVYKCSSN